MGRGAPGCGFSLYGEYEWFEKKWAVPNKKLRANGQELKAVF
jgi:hypothetical protein